MPTGYNSRPRLVRKHFQTYKYKRGFVKDHNRLKSVSFLIASLLYASIMINVTEQIIVPRMDPLFMLSRNESPKRKSLSISEGIKLWQDAISAMKKTEGKQEVIVSGAVFIY